MKIDVSKIEGYAEMTAEEKLAALEALEIGEGMVDKKLLDKANSEAADYKRQLRQAMSDAERKAAEEADRTKAMEERLKELELKETISSHKAEYLAIGYDDKTATEAANALANGDMVKAFAIQKKFVSDMRETIKAELLANTPKPEPGSGEGDKSMTKDTFRALSLDEKQKLYVSDPDLYKRMTE